ncbi:hypothetical protein C1645_819285 [Glomus cerebriforme]|uniref:Uncharacterized protein n=1 Tax=Glomus cerebriforme TaxID=658196 RepID=A0A397T881_9GLOM|nr:hypothetical protein C1645_819285 [Glomus cerebriforme]
MSKNCKLRKKKLIITKNEEYNKRNIREDNKRIEEIKIENLEIELIDEKKVKNYERIIEGIKQYLLNIGKEWQNSDEEITEEHNKENNEGESNMQEEELINENKEESETKIEQIKTSKRKRENDQEIIKNKRQKKESKGFNRIYEELNNNEN